MFSRHQLQLYFLPDGRQFDVATIYWYEACMPDGGAENLIVLPLIRRPTFHQAGVEEHRDRRMVTYFSPYLWALHFYYWCEDVSFWERKHEIRPHHTGITHPKWP